MIHLSFIFQQPIDKTEEHKKVILIQLLHTRDSLLNQFGILCIFIEKLLWCEFKGKRQIIPRLPAPKIPMR